MSGNSDKAFLLLFGGIFGGVGLLLLSLAVYFFYNTIQAQKSAFRVKGTVVEMERSRGSKGGSVYTPVVEFQLNNQTVQIYGSVASSPPAFDKGEVVDVIVNLNNPQESRIDSFIENWFGALILGFMGSIFSAIGGGVFYQGIKSWRR
ncbi:MAG: hypothetical protein OHK0057_21990 [Thermoflexibacter sp.]